MVYAEELSHIKKSVTEIKARRPANPMIQSWDPKVALLVVTKRHHVRYYKTTPTNYNLNAGMLVDHTIVAPSPQNFYLQSHDCPIGTSRNGHYVVIVNESGYSVSELQDIVSTPLTPPSHNVSV